MRLLWTYSDHYVQRSVTLRGNRYIQGASLRWCLFIFRCCRTFQKVFPVLTGNSRHYSSFSEGTHSTASNFSVPFLTPRRRAFGRRRRSRCGVRGCEGRRPRLQCEIVSTGVHAMLALSLHFYHGACVIRRVYGAGLAQGRSL